MNKFGFISCFFVLSLLFYSCASTGFLMAKPKVTLFGEKYSQKDEGATIDVYMTNKPSHEYVEFAQITVADTNDK